MSMKHIDISVHKKILECRYRYLNACKLGVASPCVQICTGISTHTRNCAPTSPSMQICTNLYVQINTGIYINIHTYHMQKHTSVIRMLCMQRTFLYRNIKTTNNIVIFLYIIFKLTSLFG